MNAAGLQVTGFWPVPRTSVQTRALNTFMREGIHTAADLTGWTSAELLELRSFGAGCLAETQRFLAAHGLHLKDSQPG